jgi:hypothetical protein
MRGVLSKLLVILTGVATLLAGIPLFAATPVPALIGGAWFSTVPFDPDEATDSRDAAGGERTEREQEADGDAKAHLFAGGSVAIQPLQVPTGSAAPGAGLATRAISAPARSIRGPPAR